MPPRHVEPRDVLSMRIEQWTGSIAGVYNHADRLLADLDEAGYEVRPKPVDPLVVPEQGAVLLLAIYMPEESDQYDPDAAATGLIGAFNELRARLDAPPFQISLIPSPQWMTPKAVAVLRRAAQLEDDDGEAAS